MKIHLLELSNGEPHEFSNSFVVEYDPAALLPNGSYDGGLLRVTKNESEARVFATPEDAVKYYRQSYGTRPDGKPNRPLTAFSVAIG